MKPRVPVAPAFRENVVRSAGGNWLAIKKVLSYSAEKAQYSSSNKKVHCHDERMENEHEETNIVGTSNTKHRCSPY